MSSLAVKLPITKDSADGFTVIRDFQTLIRQNLKMLIMTSPGERIMEPEFGVGIRGFLFENFNNSTYNAIDTAIRKQVRTFIPVVEIIEISFNGSDPDRNLLGIKLFYSVPNIGIKDLLEFTI
jgi:phage baseplate assembly protein W|tara:strand:+ start:142 stop:510 length:369 start_codon:yes stop_codon:yes gene_type:complete